MELDLNAILCALKGINPLYAVAGLAAWLVIQKARSEGGLQLGKGGLLEIIAKLLGTTKPKPVDPNKPATPAQPDAGGSGDSETLLEILAKRLKDRLRLKTQEAGGDDHAAISEYAKIVALLDRDGDGDVDADDFATTVLK